jgi:hypothetical protein
MDKTMRYIVFVLMGVTFWAVSSFTVYGEELRSFNTRVLKIKYQIPEEMKGKFTKVVFRYRANTGAWQEGGKYPAGEPIAFTAPEDGTYEFSVEPLTDGSEGVKKDSLPAFSTFRCRVDFSRPTVQIIEVDYRNDTAVVRWRAYDKGFSDRPIEIYLLKGTTSMFVGKYPNRGAAIIPIDPDELPVRVKVVGIDGAGNYGMDISREILERKPVVRTAKPKPATQPVTEGRKTATRPLVGLSSAQASEAAREYTLGTAYRLRGELKLAGEHLRRATELQPGRVEANLDLGDVFAGMGRYNDAIESYLQALMYDEHNVRGWFGLATVRGRLSQYPQVRFCLEKVVELDDKNIQAWLDLGDTYWTLGLRREAKLAWQKVQLLLGTESRPAIKAKLESRLKMMN